MIFGDHSPHCPGPESGTSGGVKKPGQVAKALMVTQVPPERPDEEQPIQPGPKTETVEPGKAKATGSRSSPPMTLELPAD